MGPLPPGEKETTNRGRLSPPPPASLNLVCLWHRGWGPFSRSGFLGTWPGCPSPTPASPAKTFVVSTSWPFSRKRGVGVGSPEFPCCRQPPAAPQRGRGLHQSPGGRGAQEWRGTPSMVGSQEQRFLGAGAARHTGKERPGHCGADSTKPPAACYASPRRPPIPGRPGAVTGTQTGPPLRKASDVGLHVAQLRTPRKEAVSERTSPDSPSRLPGSGAILLNGSGKAGGEGAVAA